MKTMKNLILTSVLIVSIGTMLTAASNGNNESVEIGKAEKTLIKAADAFENIMDDPDSRIPQSLIDQSEGIVIFPGAFKVAFGTWGGQAGRGVAMIRHDDGTWSNPFFVNLGEGSIGFQIGAQSTEMVLLFKHSYDVIEIDEAEIILGGDIGIAVGPRGNAASTDTDIKFDREIYSYTRSKGLYAGISLAGGVLSYNDLVNGSVYGEYGANPDDVFDATEIVLYDEVNELINTLNMYSE